MGVVVTGVRKVNRRLEAMKKAAGPAMREALANEGGRILNAAEMLTPRDEGNLRKSAHVDKSPPGSTRTKPIVWAIMGGPEGAGDKKLGEEGTNKIDVNYALIQHENMQFSHTLGGPKFLSRALNARKSKNHLERVEAEIRRDVVQAGRTTL